MNVINVEALMKGDVLKDMGCVVHVSAPVNFR